MAFLEKGNEGATNGTTAVDVVPVPSGADRRLVRNVGMVNRDTVVHTLVLYKDKGGTLWELAREVLQPNDYWTFDKVVVLDATDEKVVIKSDATATTTEPCFDAAYADAS